MSRIEQARTVVALRRRSRRRVDPHASLAALRRHALDHSPHYRRTHHRMDDRPLEDLPVLTKDDLIDNFDDVVVDRRLDLDGIDAFVRTGRPGEKYLGRYRIGMSSGSSGRPGFLPFDRDEWVALLANAARARSIAGPPSGNRPPAVRPPAVRRSAKISSPSPWHLSSQVGATLSDPRRPVLRLPATMSLHDVVDELEQWRPATLSAYASVLGQLADEALAGRLHLELEAVFSGAEVLNGATRDRIRDAWNVEPHDQYVTTEAGFVATECEAHDGMHLLEDHVIVEIVDDAHQPVPAGTAGTKALLTVLESRTVPLIRYELTDALREVPGSCPCGRPSRRIEVLGRARELISLGGPRGTVDVHPVLFTQVMDRQRVARWQIRCRPDGTLTVLVSGAADPARLDDIGTALRSEIEAVVGAAPVVEVELVDDIPRQQGGKRALVVVDGDRFS